MLDKRLEENGRQPLLLHVCCGPCSSGVLELLAKYFDITLYYYNPNIYPHEEYKKRGDEIQKVLTGLRLDTVQVVIEHYDETEFYQAIKGHENDPEGGDRCHICYRLRMQRAVEYAKQHGFSLFTTTLSISPYKNSEILNQIGFALAEQYGVEYLYSDFKKNNGYLRSCVLSRQLGIYRQDYCGCVYSYVARRKEEGDEK